MEDEKFKEFLAKIANQSESQIDKLHHLSKKLWTKKNFTPIDLHNKCMDTWDEMSRDLDTKIVPLIPVSEDHPVSNIIFGSGSFSTGKFQVEQYQRVLSYIPDPNNAPVHLEAIVSNKSSEHGCNGATIAKEFQVPMVELDFNDWYHEFIDPKEPSPIRASRYWFPHDSNTSDSDINLPSIGEISRRFKIRQEQFHSSLGERIESKIKHPVSIVSARGYNFQFCSNMFSFQKSSLPPVNDTHPADLRFLNPNTKVKLYAGWQSGAIELMIKDEIHDNYHGSLIEVNYMDNIKQIQSLDEGALLAMGSGVKIEKDYSLEAKQIQTAMKIMDDYLFCTLEPTGLILTWGITEKPVPVVYQSLNGDPIIVKQRAIVVGNQFHSGSNVWGLNLSKDLQELEDFLIS
ncbi:MAG: hypothetical protein ACTSVU_06835 [Promethearchaeota archaeon]